jgi:hypothetical protein
MLSARCSRGLGGLWWIFLRQQTTLRNQSFTPTLFLLIAQEWTPFPCLGRAYCAPPIALILRTIRKKEVTKMTGVLLIPLWRGAPFWLHAFPDGRHLGGVFKSFKQLKARTRLWGLSPKDAFAGQVGRLPRPGDRQPGGWRFTGVCGVAQPLLWAPFWL